MIKIERVPLRQPHGSSKRISRGCQGALSVPSPPSYVPDKEPMPSKQ